MAFTIRICWEMETLQWAYMCYYISAGKISLFIMKIERESSCLHQAALDPVRSRTSSRKISRIEIRSPMIRTAAIRKMPEDQQR